MDKQKKQQGSIIIYAISVMVILIAIAITITAIFIPKLRASTDAVNSVTALYAADSGLEWCLYVNRNKPNPPAKPIFPSGVVLEVYEDQGSSSISDCSESFLDHRAVGTYRGISRSFATED